MRVFLMFDFLKVCAICGWLFSKCWFLVGRYFEHVFFRERGPRGRSRRENSGKILAGAFSRRDFLMVLGVGHDRGRRGRSRRENSGKILAAAFSRRDFLMIFWGWGGVPGNNYFFNRPRPKHFLIVFKHYLSSDGKTELSRIMRFQRQCRDSS